MISKQATKIRIQDITYSSCVDGDGFRDVLFVNYCPHHCNGCHNKETWDEKNGKLEDLDEVYSKLTKSSITDITFSGGEPFCQAEALFELGTALRDNAHKSIWIYSGYLYEDIIKDSSKRKLLELCDVLVDGPFVESLKEDNLRFKGSTNQRIIDVPKSLASGKVELWVDPF